MNDKSVRPYYSVLARVAGACFVAFSLLLALAWSLGSVRADSTDPDTTIVSTADAVQTPVSYTHLDVYKRQSS